MWIFSWGVFWAFLAALLVRDILAFVVGALWGANDKLTEMGESIPK